MSYSDSDPPKEKRHSKAYLFLHELVKDCIIFRLTEKESLEYIERRFGKKISLQTFYNHKNFYKGDESSKIWLNFFTRVGFVTCHRELISQVEKVQDDNMRQFQIETSKPQDQRNEDKIFTLKSDIRDTVKLLSALSCGTPIISEMKSRLENEKNLRIKYTIEEAAKKLPLESKMATNYGGFRTIEERE